MCRPEGLASSSTCSCCMHGRASEMGACRAQAPAHGAQVQPSAHVHARGGRRHRRLLHVHLPHGKPRGLPAHWAHAAHLEQLRQDPALQPRHALAAAHLRPGAHPMRCHTTRSIAQQRDARCALLRCTRSLSVARDGLAGGVACAGRIAPAAEQVVAPKHAMPNSDPQSCWLPSRLHTAAAAAGTVQRRACACLRAVPRRRSNFTRCQRRIWSACGGSLPPAAWPWTSANRPSASSALAVAS